MLTKIHISNYRVFERFELEFNTGLNMLVGDNDAGKSTLLEAIGLGLTGRRHGKLLVNELSPYLFNQKAVSRYVADVQAGKSAVLPEFIIDLFLAPSEETAHLVGKNNVHHENSPGLRIKASFNPDFAPEYANFVQDRASVKLIPTEYYRVEWLSFQGDSITPRSVPATAALIDASSIRLQGGADYYLQQIITDSLEPKERVELARAYRSLREEFSSREAIDAINKKLEQARDVVSNKAFTLSIDISSRTAWETSLIPHLDDLPIQFIGKGDQNTLKILLALDKRLKASHLVLVEEPENHLSPGSLNGLVQKIEDRCAGKQVFVTTHSSFVLNKLGLDALILLGDQKAARLDDLPPSTQRFFKRLSGYDTLRAVLSPKIILVEGPSDDLIVQRAFFEAHGMTPLQAGVDVIEARGLAAKRFLDIAKPLGKTVVVVTDNDGATPDAVEARFVDYTGDGTVTVKTGLQEEGKTLEPQILTSAGREKLNLVFNKSFENDENLLDWMLKHKTEAALLIFEYEGEIELPGYIKDAVA